MGDKFTFSGDEFLSLCFRYVESNKDIRESFLEFADIERITGSRIAQKILKFCKIITYNRHGM